MHTAVLLLCFMVDKTANLHSFAVLHYFISLFSREKRTKVMYSSPAHLYHLEPIIVGMINRPGRKLLIFLGKLRKTGGCKCGCFENERLLYFGLTVQPRGAS